MAISPDQYGYRKHHKSINAVLNKVLVNDILRRADALRINDAKGCFDRIVHSVAILVLMSFGVTGHMARTMFKVLQETNTT